MCERDNLMRSVTELVPLREASMGLQLGTLLADTAETFNMKYMEWKEGPRGVPEDGRCPLRQEAAKAVEERTKVTASEQQHATDAKAKVNEQDTLADWIAQAAAATGSVTGHSWNPSTNAVRHYVPLNNQLNACQQVDDQGMPGKCKESAHSIESSLQAAGHRQDKSRSPGCPDQWRRGLAQMPTAIRGRSSTQLTQLSAYNRSVAKDPAWNNGDSLMPTTRRPLQRRCRHLVAPIALPEASSTLCLGRIKHRRTKWGLSPQSERKHPGA